jgi:hypothetical protein
MEICGLKTIIMKMEIKEGILELALEDTNVLLTDPKGWAMFIKIHDDGAYEVTYGEHMLRFHKGQMHFLTGDPDD